MKATWASKESDDDLLRLDSFPHLRRYLWASLVRTALKYAGIGVAGGIGLAAIAYFAQGQKKDIGLCLIVGVLMALPCVPVVIHWTRHFLALLAQVSILEQRVRAGESIRASEVRFTT